MFCLQGLTRAAISINEALAISFNQVLVQCLHDTGSPIDLSLREINGVSDTKGHTTGRTGR